MSKPSKVNGTTIAFVEGRKKYSLFNRSVSAVMFVSSTDAPHASEPFDLLNDDGTNEVDSSNVSLLLLLPLSLLLSVPPLLSNTSPSFVLFISSCSETTLLQSNELFMEVKFTPLFEDEEDEEERPPLFVLVLFAFESIPVYRVGKEATCANRKPPPERSSVRYSIHLASFPSAFATSSTCFSQYSANISSVLDCLCKDLVSLSPSSSSSSSFSPPPLFAVCCNNAASPPSFWLVPFVARILLRAILLELRREEFCACCCCFLLPPPPLYVVVVDASNEDE
mmetsp:Transcript_8495/g.27851  ORF Transcript_8495/g.27851 Transcript_8495/m.27851 type:complete len:281 (+) Transcript_8495:1127-1969(+)